MSTLRGVLLDSGDVLMGPRGGRWWPRPGFREVVEANVAGLPWARFDAAVEAADPWFRAHHAHGTSDPHEARAREDEYHRRILRGLGHEADAALLDAIIDGDGGPLVVFSPDARPTLLAFRERGLPVLIVSDAGPELPRFYEQEGLAELVDGFVISALVGCPKPCRAMYETAVRRIGFPPAELLFVDDREECVAGAEAAGIPGVVFGRAGPGGVPSLPALVELVDARLAGRGQA